MSHVNKPSQWVLRTSHVTYQRVMSHMNESCHIWMSHVTYQRVKSRMNESCHIRTSHVTYQRVMSQIISTSHVTCTPPFRNEGTCCVRIGGSTLVYTYYRVIPFSNATSLNESYQRVMSHMNESCHMSRSQVPYERVLSHIRFFSETRVISAQKLAGALVFTRSVRSIGQVQKLCQ